MRTPSLMVAIAVAGLGGALAGCGGGSSGSSPCGNGKLDTGETCDDGNNKALDGCSSTCQVESGWTCPFLGSACMAARCGDGIVAGTETCDDGNTTALDGCSSTCLVEAQDANGDGWNCSTPGQLCTKTTCGDKNPQGNEQCDDGNAQPFDGCYLCRHTTLCSGTQGCTSACGDGIKAPDEECDDGNTYDSDGCSSSCKLENIPGITCTLVTSDLPASIDVPVVYRDFKAYQAGDNTTHEDFENFHCNTVSTELVTDVLGATGKPVYNKNTTTETNCGHDGITPVDGLMLTGETEFNQWYTDVEGKNYPIVSSLTLNRQTGSTYSYNSADHGGFFPIDGQGFGNEGRAHNFHFTTEVRYGFTFQGDEVLDFSGDDDVWVFINGRLAVDLGGLHPVRTGSVTLDAAHATAYGLTAGYIYEMALFHAERHTAASNFWLTLGGFVKAKTECVTVCGDGVKAPNEECDDGNNSDGDGCSATCTSEAG